LGHPREESAPLALGIDVSFTSRFPYRFVEKTTPLFDVHSEGEPVSPYFLQNKPFKSVDDSRTQHHIGREAVTYVG